MYCRVVGGDLEKQMRHSFKLPKWPSSLNCPLQITVVIACIFNLGQLFCPSCKLCGGPSFLYTRCMHILPVAASIVLWHNFLHQNVFSQFQNMYIFIYGPRAAAAASRLQRTSLPICIPKTKPWVLFTRLSNAPPPPRVGRRAGGKG